MDEIDKIKKNITGREPKGLKTLIKVQNINRPKQVLETVKSIMIGFLENQTLNENSEQWNEIMPSKVIKFLNELNQEDFSNDDILFPLKSLILDLKDRDWQWYSSKVNPNGFDIITTYSFYPRFCWMIHCQNIPLSKIRIEDDTYGNYIIEVVKDVTTYKKFEGIE